MTYKTEIAAAALAGLLVATAAQAQDAAPEAETGKMPMTEGHMQGDAMTGMEGMQDMKGMMKMMAQMKPMMEACTEMMQTMDTHMKSGDHDADKG